MVEGKPWPSDQQADVWEVGVLPGARSGGKQDQSSVNAGKRCDFRLPSVTYQPVNMANQLCDAGAASCMRHTHRLQHVTCHSIIGRPARTAAVRFMVEAFMAHGIQVWWWRVCAQTGIPVGQYGGW